jgi:hypothetical protein
MLNTARWIGLARSVGKLAIFAGFLLLPSSAFAQSEPAPAFRLMDLLTLLTLGGVAFLGWQWQRGFEEDRATRALLKRLLDAGAAPAFPNQGAGASLAVTGDGSSPAASDGSSPAASDGSSPAASDGSSLTASRLDEIRATQTQQGLIFEGIHEALIMSISRLDELRKETQTVGARLAEVRAASQESSALTQTLQKLHKDAVTGLERVHVTQSGLVSAFEALKASERRDSSLLSELRAGLVQLNARLLERMEPDRSSDPTVIGLPDEYPRLGPGVARIEPLQEMLDVQSQALDAQTEMIATQGHTLDMVVRTLEQQDQERRESQQLMQRLTARLKSLEESLEQLGRLEEQGDALSAQLGELQADVGLVLKARPVRGAGRSRSPYDVQLAEEYYANLQKLIRVLMKNDKACSYALEAAQYLFEALHVQSSLCELLSSADFAIRVSPQALEEGVVRPLLERLGQSSSRTDGPVKGLLAHANGHGAIHDDLVAPRNGIDAGLSPGEDADESLPDLSSIEAASDAWDDADVVEGELRVSASLQDPH